MPGDTHLYLTPKNLYRLLKGALPGQTLPILPPHSTRGLTLVRFWRDTLTPVLTPAELDKLFPTDGTHPRIQSSLMNRSGSSSLPGLLRAALEQRLNPRILSKMIHSRMMLLSEGGYDPACFASLINHFEDRCFQDDFLIPSLQREGLLALRLWQPRDAAAGRYSPRLFLDACRLTWLSLMALYGADMGSGSLNALWLNQEARADALWLRLHQPVASDSLWRTLTSPSTLFHIPPLPADQYTASSITPEAVVGQLRQAHRLLIHGVGGCGKTELARQALPLLAAKNVYSAVAFVQYEENLADSLIRSFGLDNPDPAQAFPAVETLLRSEAGSCLLLLDNVNQSSEADAGLSLLRNLPCDILVTGQVDSLPGFDSLFLPLMDESTSAALFLTVYHHQKGTPAAPACDQKALHELYLFSAGHPLILTLLACACATHFHAPEELISHLRETGLEAMDTVYDHQTVTLTSVVRQLLHVDRLTPSEEKLLRLMALFPCLSWLPEKLADLAMDIDTGDFSLAVALQSLSDQSWLVRGDEGYFLHPFVAETLRADPFACSEFPLLWKHWAEKLTPPMTEEKQRDYELALSALLRSRDGLNDDAVRVLYAFEITAMTRAGVLLRHNLPAMHAQWLDTHPHAEKDEAELHVCRMLWALLGSPDQDYAASAEALLSLSPETLKSIDCYDVLCNVLEIGGSRLPHARLDQLFDRIRPDPDHTSQLVQYLNFLGGKQRYIDKNPRGALDTLGQARTLIEKNRLSDTVEEAANDTRMAYTLADLGQWTETLPLMRRVIENLRSRGYDENAQTMIATRNSYDFFRGKCTERQQAMDRLEEDLARMRQEGLHRSEDYLFALQNLADLALEDGDAEKAEAIVRGAEPLCRDLPATAYATQISFRLRMANILCIRGSLYEALGYVTEAELLLHKYYGEKSIDQKRCEEIKARILRALGTAD